MSPLRKVDFDNFPIYNRLNINSQFLLKLPKKRVFGVDSIIHLLNYYVNTKYLIIYPKYKKYGLKGNY